MDMHRLLRRTGRAWFPMPGLRVSGGYFLAKVLITLPLRAIPVVPGPVWDIVVTLLTVQLQTVWVHVVITPPMAAPFWKRTVDFVTVFKATAVASVLYCAANELALLALWLTSQLLGMPLTVADLQFGPSQLWKTIVSLGVMLAIKALAVTPALVVLTRIQASLLPEGLETIIPVDRTFGVENGGEKRGGKRGGLSIVQA
ncbi:hypothetical protein F5Y19DRAFT_268766 [Xylariaceae sp. FL1651]|nr:hypothetical protein F5Y19DRAFT_268766 [Xylariaceae sp. FL1651]